MVCFEELFDRGTGGNCHKWRHYFELYDRYFQKFVGTECRYLEIGVQKGGSLQIMQEYLGPQARIVGIDIDPACAALREQGREIYIGDQADPAFLAQVAQDCGPFDIIVDDGGHLGDQQIASFLGLFAALKDGGVYLVEDLHVASFQFGYQASRFGINFLDFAKGLIDKLSMYHIDPRLAARYYLPQSERQGTIAMNNFAIHEIFGVHFYDSVAVIEKRRKQEPVAEFR